MRPQVGGAARMVLVVAAASGIIVGAALLSAPAIDLSTVAASPVGGDHPVDDASLVCPGPETVAITGVKDRGTAPAPSQVTAVSPAPPAGSAPGTLGGRLLSAKGVKAPATLFDVPAATPDGAGGFRATGRVTTGSSVLVRATGSAAPGFGAAQVTLVPTGDLRGLAAAMCVPPTADSWLIGGGGDEGRRGRLVLTNPAANPVDVSIRVLSADGAVRGAAGSEMAVPARGRVTVLLDALAPSVSSPVVEVSVQGGTVAATLHDARLDGTTPTGTDDVVPSADPAREAWVPGVDIAGSSLLRVAVPGQDEAVVQIRIFGPDGEVPAPGGGVVRVPASSVRDIDLSSLPAGVYGVQVQADVPVLAGAEVERRTTTSGPADLAWVASAPVLTSPASVPAPPAGTTWQSVLAVTAPGVTGTVQVTTHVPGQAPATVTMTVPAGTTRTMPLPAGADAWVVPRGGSGPVVAARSLSTATPQGTLISVSSLTSAPSTQRLTTLAPAG